MSKISGKMITSVSAVALAAATLAFSASAAFDQDSAGAEEAASTKAAVVTDAIALDGEGTLLFDYVADVNGTEASGEDVTYVTEASPALTGDAAAEAGNVGDSVVAGSLTPSVEAVYAE